jgi:hypothetical protein
MIDDAEHFNTGINYNTAIQDAVFYMNSTMITSGFVNSSGVIHEVKDVLDWTAALIKGTGAVMSLTIVPTVKMSRISTEGLDRIGQKCKDINEFGLPVLLRFAPDMNGN